MQKNKIQLGKGMAALLGNNPGSYTDAPSDAPIEPKKKLKLKRNRCWLMWIR